MFLIRQSRPEDVSTLLKLARMVYFINLPPDERIITSKIAHSRECFLRLAADGPDSFAEQVCKTAEAPVGLASQDSELFMFTLEETDSGGVVGTSQIKARMGGPGNPNYSFKLFQREFRSVSLGYGSTHLVARLHEDTSGPTEIGGLIIQPSFRGHRRRPGRFLSFVRFHFMALFRKVFSDRILAEMAPPITSDGDNLFWDHIGRKFIPVKYSEADRFCQHNRKFIDELMPKDDIYLTLLPLEVLNQVGKVGPDTIPARRMLERLGFEYRHAIDPFDGGPHLEAITDQLSLVRQTRLLEIGPLLGSGRPTHRAIVSLLHPDGEFRSVDCDCVISDGAVRLAGEAAELLMAEEGQECGVTPLDAAGGEDASGQSKALSRGAKRSSTKRGKAAAAESATAASTSKPSPVKPAGVKPSAGKPARAGARVRKVRA